MLRQKSIKCLIRNQYLFQKTQHQISTTAAVIALIYGSASQFLLRNPHYIHKKIDLKNNYLNQIIENSSTAIVAHRGGAHEAPENTIQAFQHALDNQSKILEMDLCLTKDQQVVVSHDKHIERVTGNKKYLNELNYNEINNYLPKVELEFSESKEYLQIKNNQDYFIPKFEEILKKFPDSILLVDLKEPNQVLISKTIELIEKYQAQNQIILGTQFIDDWQKINFQNMFSSQNHLIKIHLLHLTGLLPFFKLDICCLATPLYTKAYYQWEMELSEGKFTRKMLMKLQFFMIKIFNLFNYSLFQHLRKRGILSFYWVANKQEEILRALKDKPSGIITDYPMLMKEIIKSQKEQND
ncbi:glycerophosphodiester phosphodiesterase (macronuclear) [Tetrahymena thermophila SB210]|uniref:Glycerophosphodiester phosphodiesterase n=1 Tax=Tetrahymena thermophila (strain SB210) TaxID=312017 RepID=W7XJM1_TETTS|nr:glycerophosphodiester phosphodiesterase [Tetrahymena thermophila SB210]EWS75656.1 glycerophosphodiester phosphodiesterase [Tetrahymena thermophila SB210]|eukprot:XP_012651802.1 glycerophosphodiester phosphodiesterase [Tetrahymena thermophila SB210]